MHEQEHELELEHEGHRHVSEKRHMPSMVGEQRRGSEDDDEDDDDAEALTQDRQRGTIR